MGKRTTQIRVRPELKEIFNTRFPGVKHADLIDLAFKTSPLSLESKLRKVDFTNKFGMLLYGKKIWERRFGKTTKRK